MSKRRKPRQRPPQRKANRGRKSPHQAWWAKLTPEERRAAEKGVAARNLAITDGAIYDKDIGRPDSLAVRTRMLRRYGERA